MKKIILIFAFIFSSYLLKAQVGIGTITPKASSALEIHSSDKGILFPRVKLLSTTDVATIPQPADALTVYNIGAAGDVTPGYYYWSINSVKWVRMLEQSSSWLLRGNTGTNPDSNFIGTLNDQDVVFKANNKIIGRIGEYSTSLGLNALANDISNEPSVNGSVNTALGFNALANNTTGTRNTAMGARSMLNTTTGGRNTIAGSIMVGSVGSGNGTDNVSIGAGSLSNSSASFNTAVGNISLTNANMGGNSVAIGMQVLHFTSAGQKNVAVGSYVLWHNSTSNLNTVIGNHHVENQHNNFNTDAIENGTAIGSFAITTSNSVRLGNLSISKIQGYVAYSQSSDRRYKENIKDMPLGMAFINKIRPVEYTRKNNTENTSVTEITKEWGVIAQELQQVLQSENYNDAGIVQDDGSAEKMLSVRYTDLLAPMIKALQELAATDTVLEAQNTQIENRMEQSQLAIDEIKNWIAQNM